MTAVDYSIQYSFNLSNSQIWQISPQSKDVYGHLAQFDGSFCSSQPKKQSLEPETYPQQLRKKAYGRIIRKLELGNLPGAEHAISYLQEKYRRNMSVHTICCSGFTAMLFLSFLKKHGCYHIAELSRQDIEAYVEHEQDRGLTARAIKTRLGALYAFLNYLVKKDILPAEILQRKINVKVPLSLPRAIESGNVEAMLAVMPSLSPRDRALLLLLLRTGMRIGELLNLYLSDVNMQEQKIAIYIGEKNAKGRVVYFCEDARDALTEWVRTRDPQQKYLFYGQKDKPLSYVTARRIFMKCLEAAGLEGKQYTLHQLRHTFATELLNVGMRLEVLQQLLGHSSIEMTRHYARLTDKTREEEYFRAMQRIEQECC